MVYFVGAGAGDPELLTIKGKRLIDNADVVIYAGSLVNPEVLKDVKKDCAVYDSAGMNLEEVLDVMKAAEAEGKTTVRVHTGDSSIYGAIREQLDALDKLNIEHEVVPGVSSFLAAAAAMQKEYTLPDVTQTVILTRMEGRTPVPERESIEELAKHRATMVLFLSVGMIDELVMKLKTSYPETTPVAVVYKASWPDQKIIYGTLSDIAAKVKEAGIKKTALVTVGDFLGNEYELSKLYDKTFTHEYRQGISE
ncbi:MAG: precorrin-4 C(11)-methyltransferase [Oscillospiraceae bacterium]|nr:precorrin-4 C(11)-methyltransferase [Oscillospiraceae bacterium]MDD6081816.1 precorrin-4 C(11)-methyltransferase [Oscillospiraceae bacterium]MDO5150649.1 precorrin-4 C(11)-methyltransferase [Oscillospiraceae bacterium]